MTTTTPPARRDPNLHRPSRLARLRTTLAVQRQLMSSRSFRSRVLVNCLAFIGAVGAVLQVLQIWLPNLNEPRSMIWIGVFVLFGLIVVVWRSAPEQSVEYYNPSFAARIIIEAGDLLAPENSPAVITSNRHLDTGTEWVADSSLMGQVCTMWYGDGLAGRALMAEQIGALTGQPAGYEHPIGTVVPVAQEGQSVLILAVSSRHPETRSAVLIDDIWTALSGLWTHARRQDLHTISVPIIGSGFAKAQVGALPLLVLLLTSYVTAAMERPVCTLRIVLPTQIIAPAMFEVTKTYCESLGFKQIG